MTSGNGHKDRLDAERDVRDTSEARVEAIAEAITTTAPGSWTCADEMKDWITTAVDAAAREHGLDDGAADYLFDCVSGSGVFPVMAS